MQHGYPIEHIARVVVEATTPLSIGTGSPDGIFDTALVTDANGLPALPGSALAGVLRALWREQHASSEDSQFGYQEQKDGARSRLDVSWGVLLDSRGRAVEGLVLDAARLDDPLLNYARRLAREPRTRDRVRIGARGAALDTGKFNRAVLPAGFRFALELRLRGEHEGDADWHALLDLLAHPALRLGGATRAGLGRLHVVRVHEGRFDRRDAAQAEAWRGLPRQLDASTGLQPYTPNLAVDGWLQATLCLRPRGPWRIGQGTVEVGELKSGKASDDPAKLLAVTEPRVRWDGNRGVIDDGHPALLIPAASVKGALAHRFAYHAHRHAGRWAEDAGGDAMTAAVDNPERDLLFGLAKDDDQGQAGCLFIDDTFLEVDAVKPQQVMHNSIDRFTGGVRDRVLFAEESLWDGSFEIPLLLDGRRLADRGDTAAVRAAVRDALADLCEGRLAFGSRTTSGNGFMTGHIRGPLAAWLQGDTVREEAA